jgi:hypothetical protein
MDLYEGKIKSVELSKAKTRGHTDLNHGPIGLQPIALPLSYIPTCYYCKCYTFHTLFTEKQLQTVKYQTLCILSTVTVHTLTFNVLAR